MTASSWVPPMRQTEARGSTDRMVADVMAQHPPQPSLDRLSSSSSSRFLRRRPLGAGSASLPPGGLQLLPLPHYAPGEGEGEEEGGKEEGEEGVSL